MTAPLSEHAERYISSMSDVSKRRAARDYASMDPAEFQARLGCAVDEIMHCTTRKRPSRVELILLVIAAKLVGVNVADLSGVF